MASPFTPQEHPTHNRVTESGLVVLVFYRFPPLHHKNSPVFLCERQFSPLAPQELPFYTAGFPPPPSEFRVSITTSPFCATRMPAPPAWRCSGHFILPENILFAPILVVQRGKENCGVGDWGANGENSVAQRGKTVRGRTFCGENCGIVRLCTSGKTATQRGYHCGATRALQ